LTVGIGEIISCGIFGAILLKSLKKYNKFMWKFCKNGLFL
jgi:hypothetical protein